ncbi:MAG: AAA family ATPase [Planctomycetes bacterium]|nr:AAA family ATPase [Planctomycetota bacterium]
MFLHNIKLQNLLSFGPDGIDLPLRDLNVLIGPNGSGKSNLIEAVSLLQAAPKMLATPIQNSGGVGDWIWKGKTNHFPAAVEVVVAYPHGSFALQHAVSFKESDGRFELVRERIEDDSPVRDAETCVQYNLDVGETVVFVSVKGQTRPREFLREEFDPTHSILSGLKDPYQYPEITYLGEQYEKIRIYREWSFGRYTSPRLPQNADYRDDFLDEDFVNLGLVLNRLRQDASAKARILEMLARLYVGIEDFGVNKLGNTVQIFLKEGVFEVPATRLSDGTLRYLCLLAILCHPEPPPLICIEEPELGLHPDIMPTLAELLKDASTRTQLIVTTHSDVLIDALSESPEDVIVCEKNEGSSVMRRLDAESLRTWLSEYGLGQLWRRGEIGGNRW